jgi:hypothetical protein
MRACCGDVEIARHPFYICSIARVVRDQSSELLAAIILKKTFGTFTVIVLKCISRLPSPFHPFGLLVQVASA